MPDWLIRNWPRSHYSFSFVSKIVIFILFCIFLLTKPAKNLHQICFMNVWVLVWRVTLIQPFFCIFFNATQMWKCRRFMAKQQKVSKPRSFLLVNELYSVQIVGLTLMFFLFATAVPQKRQKASKKKRERSSSSWHLLNKQFTCT